MFSHEIRRISREIRRISKDQQLPGMVRPMFSFVVELARTFAVNLFPDSTGKSLPKRIRKFDMRTRVDWTHSRRPITSILQTLNNIFLF